MSPKARLSVELSEKRDALNSLLSVDPATLSVEQRSELPILTTRLQEIEIELRGAIVAEEASAIRFAGSPEERELHGLIRRADLANIYTAALNHGHTSGVEKELQEHFQLADNQVPIDCLQLEQRAVTPAPTDTGATQAPIVPYVFPQSAAAFLNVDTPRVSMGDAVYPVITAQAAVSGPHTDSTSVSETTGSFSADVLVPSRLQASFFYKRTDAARFSGMGESLRENLNMALEDAADKDVLTGTEGLFSGSKLADHDVSAVTTYADYKSNFAYGRVDGRYASGVGEIRILMGGSTFSHASTVFRGANADQSALDELMMKTGGVRVSAHVPAVVSKKQEGVIRLGMRRDMVQAHWSGISLIPDEVTRSDTGEIKITAVLLVATKILRAAGFFKQQIQIP